MRQKHPVYGPGFAPPRDPNTAVGRPRLRLDSPGGRLKHFPFSLPNIMGQQLNKYIKRKRRAAYLKRKKERTKATAKKK